MKTRRTCIPLLSLIVFLSLLIPAAAQIPLGEAVDAPALTWTTGGDADWFGQDVTYRTNGSAAQSGAIGDSQSSYMETTVTGQVWIRFYWSVSSESDHDYLIFYIDGVEKARLSGIYVTFISQAHRLGSGTHTLRWEYVKDAAGSSGSDCGWIDSFEILDTYTLAEAVDDTLFTWSTGGDEGWFGTEWQWGHDSDLAQSGVISDSQSSFIETTVVGPGLFNYASAVYSDGFGDYLSFTVNGISANQVSGSVRKIALQGGSHTLRWEYIKDEAGSAYADYASLDNVTFAAPLPLAEALDNSVLSFATGGDSEWIGRAETKAYNNNDAQSGILADGQSAWIETTVTGPGHISFNHGIQATSEASSLLRFSVDGTREKSYGYTVLGGYASNGPYGHPIPSGSHTLRWTFDKDSGGTGNISTAWLDRVFFLPPVDLGEALDNTSLTWTTGGDADWMGQTVFTSSYSADDAAQSGMIDHNESSWIGTTVTGPGILQYSWKTTSEGASDYLSFSIDGVVQEQISGGSSLSPGGWSSRRLIVPSGVLNLQWEYAKDDSGSWSNDSGYLNAVSYTPAIPLGEAVDNTDLAWTTGGDAEWIGHTLTSRPTGDLAESGPIGDGQSTWIETTVDGPGVLSFDTQVSAEVDHDFLIVTLDGVELRRTSSEYFNYSAGHFPFMVIIPAGSHQVRWTYTKDASGSVEEDRAVLDEVSYSPLIDLDEALDSTVLVFTTGGDKDWGGQTLVSHNDGDAAAGGWIGVGETSWIETTVTGPGIITFFWKFRAAYGPYHDFEERRYVVPDGDHTLRWTYSRPSEHSLNLAFTDNGALKEQIAETDVDFDHSALLDQIVYATGLPLEVVLFTPDWPSDILTYTTGGDADWVGVPETPGTTGGDDLAVSGWIDDGQSSWIETTVQGPGQLAFSSAVSSEHDKDQLKLYLDGVFKGQISGGAEGYWSNFHLNRQTIPAGSHTVRWEYGKDSDGRWGADWAKIDWVIFNPGVPLADALDGPGITWTTGGGAPWEGIASAPIGFSIDLVDAAQNGLVAPGETSWLETVVTGPGVFSFFVKGNFSSNLSFSVDGGDVPLTTYAPWWGRNNVILSEGSHTLRWEYTRGPLGLGGEPEFIDLAYWEPTVSIAEAVDNADLVWTTGGTAPYGQTAVSQYDGDAVRTGWNQSWLETTVEGPGYVAFSWKMSPGTPGSDFSFLIDGEEKYLVHDKLDWERVWTHVPAGTHTLRWMYDGSSHSYIHGQDCGWLDHVVYMPPIPLQEALDDPGMTWTTGGSAEWFGEVEDFVYGASAAQSGNNPGYGGDSWLETTVNGPAIVSFDWKSENGDSYGADSHLLLKIDGADKFEISGDTGWERGYPPVPGGSHTLRWEHVKDRGHAYGEKGFLDHVERSAPVPLAVALDNDYLIFTTGSGREWLGQAETFTHGGSAAQSTAIGHNDSSSMEATVHGPGTISFHWKVSSHNSDRLAFYVDGGWQAGIDGSVDWTEETFAIPTGEHVVRWEYSKNHDFDDGSDAGWVDRVIYTAEAESTVCPTGCDHADIQSAIADAVPMQTILVGDGHYTGPVDFLGKIITLTSENGPEHAIIDAGGVGSAVTFSNGEGPQSILDGFTLTGGAGTAVDGSSGDDPGTYGGGIYGEFSSPTIRNCVVSGNNSPHKGGGAYFYGSAPRMADTYVRGNSSGDGGGLYLNLSDAELVNLVVSGNAATAGGGGLYLKSSDGVVVNSTVVSNAAAVDGGGVKSWSSSPVVVNTLLWGNEAGGFPDQLWETTPGSAAVAYSDVEGGDPGSPGSPWPGTGNVDADPAFVNPRPASEAPTTAGNYHLMPDSPARGAGTGDAVTYPELPAGDIDGDDRGASYDMGADEYRGSGSTDELVVDFGSQGCWHLSGASWRMLSSWSAGRAEAWSGGMAADFGSNGLWNSDGAGWTMLTSWSTEDMTAWEDRLAVDFGSNGLWDWTGSGWRRLAGWDAEGLATWKDRLAVDFGANGLWSRGDSGWSSLATWDSEDLVSVFGNLCVDFGAMGLWSYDGSSWEELDNQSPESMTPWSGGLAVDFGADGLWSWNGSSWTLLTGWDCEGFTAWHEGLAVDFGANGLWSWNGSAWRRLSGWNPEMMTAWGEELAVDFGSAGLWSWDDASWLRLMNWDPSFMSDVDLE